MQVWLNMAGRGLFGARFKLEEKWTIKEQIAEIKKAFAASLITESELLAFATILEKELQLTEYEQLKKEVEDLKKMYGQK
jgi:hypothetical protein